MLPGNAFDGPLPGWVENVAEPLYVARGLDAPWVHTTFTAAAYLAFFLLAVWRVRPVPRATEGQEPVPDRDAHDDRRLTCRRFLRGCFVGVAAGDDDESSAHLARLPGAAGAIIAAALRRVVVLLASLLGANCYQCDPFVVPPRYVSGARQAEALMSARLAASAC